MTLDSKISWVVEPGLTGWICGKIHSDGSMTVYKFQTKEWAELCKRSMDRFDKFDPKCQWMWSTGTINWAIGGQYITTSSMRELTMTHFDLENRPILVMDHNRQVIKLDVPAIIYLWLKTTWIPKAWKRLLWGEKAKQ